MSALAVKASVAGAAGPLPPSLLGTLRVLLGSAAVRRAFLLACVTALGVAVRQWYTTTFQLTAGGHTAAKTEPEQRKSVPPPEPVQSAPIAPSADKTKSSGIDVFHIRHDFNKETYGKSWKLGDDLHLVVGDVVMATLPMQSAQQTSPKWMHGRIIGSLQSQDGSYLPPTTVQVACGVGMFPIAPRFARRLLPEEASRHVRMYEASAAGGQLTAATEPAHRPDRADVAVQSSGAKRAEDNGDIAGAGATPSPSSPSEAAAAATVEGALPVATKSSAAVFSEEEAEEEQAVRPFLVGDAALVLTYHLSPASERHTAHAVKIVELAGVAQPSRSHRVQYAERHTSVEWLELQTDDVTYTSGWPSTGVVQQTQGGGSYVTFALLQPNTASHAKKAAHMIQLIEELTEDIGADVLCDI